MLNPLKLKSELVTWESVSEEKTLLGKTCDVTMKTNEKFEPTIRVSIVLVLDSI